ncbi:GntR family transcriptional regulator [Saccharopolyspora gloriosae]|uniref:GntR family transcriptional regulator n=1 Tax=Saccharopolyspora gloriosae TaxID=455344 RepID=UPI001FB59DBC|nr:GntR family transcriptional regulator [Saccharopolyspora gloriosae]
MSSDSPAAGRSPRTAKSPVARRALRDTVYDVVLEGILDGTYPPGDSLGIDQLARDLGVSPTPIREALVQMEHTGLVTRAALKGYRVAPLLTDEQMADLITARTVVELAAVEQAVARGAELIPQLRVAHARHTLSAHKVGELRSAGSRPDDYADLREYFDSDWDFHLVILRGSGNRYLLQMAESLGTHVHRLRQSLDREVFDVDEAVTEHAAVLAAFENGDPVEAMRAHLQGVGRRSLPERA